MWGFIIYIIIGYTFYTFSYLYLSNEYEFPVYKYNFKKYSIIITISIITGLFWPLVLIKYIVYLINKYKNK